MGCQRARGPDVVPRARFGEIVGLHPREALSGLERDVLVGKACAVRAGSRTGRRAAPAVAVGEEAPRLNVSSEAVAPDVWKNRRTCSSPRPSRGA